MRNPFTTMAVLVPALVAVLIWSADARAQCTDLDGDGWGDPGDVSCPSGSDLDCDDGDNTVYPGAPDVCDAVLDNDCDGATDPLEDDVDGDGFTGCDGDCDDADALVYPGAAEVCNDGIDNDCDGGTPDIFDADGDGSDCDLDCDDTNADAFPGNTEVCDGADNDCDGSVGPTEVDVDEDGWLACIECDDNDATLNLDDLDMDGYSTCHDDCDDDDAERFPGNMELCDGIDNDCNDDTDELVDGDGDGFSACDDPADCDDTDATVFPGATEICDGQDTDCDDATSEDVDDDGDTYTECDGDCDDTDAAISPDGVEICNGADDNCDDTIDEGFDVDGDGFVDGANDDCVGAYEPEELDCDDDNADVNPEAVEVCDDEIDNDCNEDVDGDDEECANLAPVADAGYDQQARYLAGMVTLRFDGTGSYDPEATDLLYTWAIDQEPTDGVKLNTLVTASTSPYAFLVVEIDDVTKGPWDFTLSLKVSENGNPDSESELDFVQGHIYIDDPIFPTARCDVASNGRPSPASMLFLVFGGFVLALRRR